MQKGIIGRMSIVIWVIVLLIVSGYSNNSGRVEFNSVQPNLMQLYDDFDTLNASYDIDSYSPGSIWVSEGYLVINEVQNGHSHIQSWYNGSNVLEIETKFNISVSSGATYGPGIGIYWDSFNALKFQLAYDGGGPRLNRHSLNQGVHSASRVDLAYAIGNFIYLKIVNTPNNFITLYYSHDGINWIDYSQFESMAWGDPLVSSSFSKTNTTLVMAGKGTIKDPLDTNPDNVDAGGEFNNYYVNLGNYGFSYFEYLSIDYEESQELSNSASLESSSGNDQSSSSSNNEQSSSASEGISDDISSSSLPSTSASEPSSLISSSSSNSNTPEPTISNLATTTPTLPLVGLIIPNLVISFVTVVFLMRRNKKG